MKEDLYSSVGLINYSLPMDLVNAGKLAPVTYHSFVVHSMLISTIKFAIMPFFGFYESR